MIELVELVVGKRKVVGDHFACNGKRESLVILLHGFLSSKESVYSVAEALNKHGIDALAIDFNGHGNSGGDLSEFTISNALDDCSAALDYAKKQGYSKIGLFGFSIGGFIALCFMHERKFIPETCALCAPLSNYTEIFGKSDVEEWRGSGMLKAKGLGLNIKIDYKFYEDGISHDGYEKWNTISSPILILHGTEDTVVPISQSEALIKYLPNAHLLRISGANHNVFSGDFYDQTIDALSKWFKSKL
jgi:pimeloyl-ACP methyl ester carboxylesterase